MTNTEDPLIPVNTRIPEKIWNTRPGPESGPVPGLGKALPQIRHRSERATEIKNRLPP